MTRQRRSAPKPQRRSRRELVVQGKYDYAPLDAAVAQQVQTAAHRIRLLVKKTLEDLITVGQELLAVKAALPHGGFVPWLRAEFGWTERTVRHFMAVAQRFGPKTEIISDLRIQPTAAYLLAAPSVPEEVCAAAIRRAESGEKITVSVAKEMLDTLKKQSVRRAEEATLERPRQKLMGELIASLESFRRRWAPAEILLYVRELRDYADFLEQSNRKA